MTVAVELVYDKACPNVGEARASLRQALTAVGLPAEWTEWEASAPSAPAHARRPRPVEDIGRLEADQVLADISGRARLGRSSPRRS